VGVGRVVAFPGWMCVFQYFVQGHSNSLLKRLV
jgi:hypothetical protein